MELLVGVAEANLPAVERKVQQLQLQLGGDAGLQLWDREWAEQQQQQQQGRAESMAGTTESLCTERTHALDLGEAIDGLSAYLELCMGVRMCRVQAEAAPPSTMPLIHCDDINGDATEGRAHTSDYRLHLARLLARLASQPEATQGSCSSPWDYRPPLLYLVHKEAADVEGRPTGHWRPLGHLIIEPAAAGCGARFFAHRIKPQGRDIGGEGGRSNKAGEKTADDRGGCGHLPVVLVRLKWPAVAEGCLDPLGASSAALLELMHEMGHALHFLLVDGGGLACHPGGDRARPQTAADVFLSQPIIHEPCPSSLPLELLEVPSSLFELLAADSRVLLQILPASLPRESVLSLLL